MLLKLKTSAGKKYLWNKYDKGLLSKIYKDPPMPKKKKKKPKRNTDGRSQGGIISNSKNSQ